MERVKRRSLTENVAQDKGILEANGKLSNGHFMERQGDLMLCKGDLIANVRMECLNEQTMTEYFTMLKDVMTIEKLLNSLSQICNVDETGMPMDHRPPKVITSKEGVMLNI